MPHNGKVDCLCCLGEGTAQLKLDRKNRPFIRCGACGAMTFCPTEDSLKGIAFLVPAVRELLTRMGMTGVTQARVQARELLTQMKEAANG